MHKLILVIFTALFAVSACAKDDRIVYQYKESNGSTLLSNKPYVNKDLEVIKAQKYVPSTTTVNVPAKDVYKRSWCKIDKSIVPCYNYQNTIPAHSYTEESAKVVRLTDQELQEKMQNAAVEQAPKAQ